ncbi:hypothetical protein PGTUg99_015578 [Puccinia graminis f. sp. tritici]|uniref:Uncharacterized protein n=1 Tax=Puccinia graminis f. sp. tritici TaxID=56615 RepID=A0A5B0SET8_PUCGR|nr:hypothetical protein PGTUg99_015578 [Puccinia graminis f. sp. tritici]
MTVEEMKIERLPKAGEINEGKQKNTHAHQDSHDRHPNEDALRAERIGRGNGEDSADDSQPQRRRIDYPPSIHIPQRPEQDLAGYAADVRRRFEDPARKRGIA